MSQSKGELSKRLARLEHLREQVQKAVSNVLSLLDKAEKRRSAEGGRRWDLILDHLEQTLMLMRARLTAYECDARELGGRLQVFDGGKEAAAGAAGAGEAGAEAAGARPLAKALEDFAGDSDALSIQITLGPDAVGTADRVLAIPIEKLQAMTLEEVEAMHDRLFGSVAPEPMAQPDRPRKTLGPTLESRIAKAREKREALAAKTQSKGLSFVERRRHHLLRKAIQDLQTGRRETLTLEEADLLVSCHAALLKRETLGENDQRLRALLDPFIEGVKQRAAALRQNQVRKLRK